MTEKDSDPVFHVKKWHAVTLWQFDFTVENCAICRNHIMELCIEAQANPDGYAGGCETPCMVASGTCNHAFHHCCITRWLRSRGVCPLCDKDWEFAKVDKQSA
eukprot:TRINITY_DN6240_c0_g1_i1.p1 TRINITY_DN6240_c0_g1~~TRINITY_DN6240_c0_g1_i1.p1  ORF type:complete len:103 (-),score=10.65 TRINITY_DN6240_c0_g1_i1:127-435(-)